MFSLRLYIIQFIVTFCCFYIEALIHYNIGKVGYIGIAMPPLKQNILIMGVIVFFSFVCSGITYHVENVLNKSSKIQEK